MNNRKRGVRSEKQQQQQQQIEAKQENDPIQAAREMKKAGAGDRQTIPVCQEQIPTKTAKHSADKTDE
jgi:hypothetical protein